MVAELRQLAAEVADPVRELTGLPGAADDGLVAVVDRPGWIRANVDGFRVVLDPLVEHLAEKGGTPPGGSVISAVGSRVTGMQAGPDPGLPGRPGTRPVRAVPAAGPEAAGRDAPAGRLTLVAPNIVMVERELGVDPSDFRRWVCLHEETHRTQFTSVAWLRPYVQQQMTEFLLASDLDPASILDRLRGAADAVAGRGPRTERRCRPSRMTARLARRRQPHRGHPEPAAARDPGAADLGDDAGRGARRLRDGRRRADRGAVGRADPGQVLRPARLGRAGSSRRCAASWAST